MGARGLPGGLGGGMDPRQVGSMMKRFGIDVRDIEGVTEVVVKTPQRDYVFRKPSVSVMKAQGVETWQVSGLPETVERGSGSGPAKATGTGSPPGGSDVVADEAAASPPITDDDVDLVVSQTGATKEKARAALEATDGDLAEAILRLKP